MKIRVSCVNLADPVFTHDDNCVCVMHEITGQKRNLSEGLCRDLFVTVSFSKNAKRRACQHCGNKFPRLLNRPRFGEDLRVGAYPQEFVADAPSEIPCSDLGSPLFKQFSAGDVCRRAAIGSIKEDIRVNDEH